jgi:hypothetical protein
MPHTLRFHPEAKRGRASSPHGSRTLDRCTLYSIDSAVVIKIKINQTVRKKGWVVNQNRLPRCWSCSALRNLYIDDSCLLWWDRDGQLWGWFASPEAAPALVREYTQPIDADTWTASARWAPGPVRLRVRAPASWTQNSTPVVFNAVDSGFPLRFPWNRHDRAANLITDWGSVPLQHIARGIYVDLEYSFGIDADGIVHVWTRGGAHDLQSSQPRHPGLLDREAATFVRDDSRDWGPCILFTDGSLATPGFLLGRDFPIGRIAGGVGLDSPIDAVTSPYCGIRDVIVRTKTGAYYRTPGIITGRNPGRPTSSMSVNWTRVADERAYLVFENTAGERIISLIPPHKTGQIVRVPTAHPIVDLCYTQEFPGSDQTIALLDSSGLIYRFTIHAASPAVSPIHPLPLNPNAPVQLTY